MPAGVRACSRGSWIHPNAGHPSKSLHPPQAWRIYQQANSWIGKLVGHVAVKLQFAYIMVGQNNPQVLINTTTLCCICLFLCNADTKRVGTCSVSLIKHACAVHGDRKEQVGGAARPTPKDYWQQLPDLACPEMATICLRGSAWAAWVCLSRVHLVVTIHLCVVGSIGFPEARSQGHCPIAARHTTGSGDRIKQGSAHDACDCRL